jgi:PAS domain S-box-containing protein
MTAKNNRISSNMDIERSSSSHATRHDQVTEILESITDGFCAFDHDWRYTYFNAAAERIIGLSRDEVIGRNHWELFPEARGTIIEREYFRAVRDQVPVEFEVWYEPQQRWYAVRAYPTRQGGLSACFCDTTKRKRTAEAPDKSETEFQTPIEAFAQIIWTTDAEGTVVEDSPSWRAFTGQSFEEWKGSGWLECIHPEDRMRTAASWRQTVARRKSLSLEYRVRHASGRWRWAMVNAVPLRDREGNVTGWVGMNTDITERKNAEMERDHANAMLRAILDSSPDAIAAKDHEGRYIALNQSAAKIFGRPGELAGHTNAQVPGQKVSRFTGSERDVMHPG